MGKDRSRPRSRSSSSFELMPGDAGFLLTCWQGRERQCLNESLALFSRYTDTESNAELPVALEAKSESGPESKSESKSKIEVWKAKGREQEKETRPSQKRKLVSESLQDELLALGGKQTKATASCQCVQNVKMGDMSCLVFLKLLPMPAVGPLLSDLQSGSISSSQVHPRATELCYRVWNDVLSKGPQGTRTCQRMIPIEGTCYANIKALVALVEELLNVHVDYFEARSMTGAKTLEPGPGPESESGTDTRDRETFHPSQLVPFDIVYQSRYNNSLSREVVTSHLAPMILARSPSLSLLASNGCSTAGPGRFYVDLNGSARVTLIVQVMKNIAGVALLKDYARVYKKGNLMAMNDVFVEQQCVAAASPPQAAL